MPPAEYGHHSEPKTEECAHDHCRKRWEVQKVSDYHRDAGGKCSNGIKICPEYSRSFVHENITQHSASNSSQHPHNRSHHWIESGGQRFLRTGDGEQSQAGAIEQQHRPAVHVDFGIPEKYHQASQQTDAQITPVVYGCRWNGADQQVSGNPPCVPCREGKHHQAEQIELALDARCCTAECEDECTQQVERDQKRAREVFSVNQNVVHDANQACAATTRAFTPVSKVGWITGANRGLWLVGSSLSVPSFFAFS